MTPANLKTSLKEFLVTRGIDLTEGFGLWIVQDEFGGVERTIRETLDRCESHGIDPVVRKDDVVGHVFALLGRAWINANK